MRDSGTGFGGDLAAYIMGFVVGAVVMTIVWLVLIVTDTV